jgi:hypothetical protein
LFFFAFEQGCVLVATEAKSEGRRRFFQKEKNGKRRRIVRAGFVAAAE